MRSAVGLRLLWRVFEGAATEVINLEVVWGRIAKVGVRRVRVEVKVLSELESLVIMKTEVVAEAQRTLVI